MSFFRLLFKEFPRFPSSRKESLYRLSLAVRGGEIGTRFLSKFNTISLTALIWSALACCNISSRLFRLASFRMASKNGRCRRNRFILFPSYVALSSYNALAMMLLVFPSRSAFFNWRIWAGEAAGFFRVAAFKAFLAPQPAAPEAAPRAAAFPAATRAGIKAAKGKRPPFCPILFLCPRFLRCPTRCFLPMVLTLSWSASRVIYIVVHPLKCLTAQRQERRRRS